MYERLIENWLDSASERSYQASFCQMLNAQCYEVLHSTRHSPIEFGKDVISRSPDGVICAYQLKGNPGSRLTVNELREIQAQLIQLVSQPVLLPGVPQSPHRSFLVTNGEVDEEARQALREIGEGLRPAGYSYPEIELLPRGTLLAWAKALGSDLWPSELENVSQLLEILMENGRKIPSVSKLHVLLGNILRLLGTSSGPLPANEVRRRISSSALFVGISLKNFDREQNHYASIVAWTLFAVYAIGACERFRVSYERNAKQSVELAKTAIFDALCDLCDELRTRGHIVEGNPLTDTPFYPARQLLLSALMALFWFWAKYQGWPSETHKQFVEAFIPDRPQAGWLWGEGSIPQWLIYLWYKRASDATPGPDMHLAKLLEAVCQHNTKKQLEAFASPYYTIEDVVRHQLRDILGGEDGTLADETSVNASFSAEGLMHLLVRTGLKQTCKKIWPDYSLLNLHWFEPSSKWQYCLWRS